MIKVNMTVMRRDTNAFWTVIRTYMQYGEHFIIVRHSAQQDRMETHTEEEFKKLYCAIEIIPLQVIEKEWQ